MSDDGEIIDRSIASSFYMCGWRVHFEPELMAMNRGGLFKRTMSTSVSVNKRLIGLGPLLRIVTRYFCRFYNLQYFPFFNNVNY